MSKVAIDPKRFLGVHSVADAVEYLYSGKSTGKVQTKNAIIVFFLHDFVTSVFFWFEFFDCHKENKPYCRLWFA